MADFERRAPRVLPVRGLAAPRLETDRRGRQTLRFPTSSRAEAEAFLEGWRAAEQGFAGPEANETGLEEHLTAFCRCLGVQPLPWRWARRPGYWGWLDYDMGEICLNIELRRYPAVCAEEVLAHECCHLRQREHSEVFWALLRELQPGWAWREGLLRGLRRKEMRGWA